MKKILTGLLCATLTCFVVGCSPSETTDVQHLVGYMVIDGDSVYIDQVEIITREDTDRIAELGLVESNDYPGGYHIYNPEPETVTLSLDDETKYVFVDYGLRFVDDAEGDRQYQTKKIQEFIDGSAYRNLPMEEQRIPYFFEAQLGTIVSITEEFIYTQ